MGELLFWISLDCMGVPNEVTKSEIKTSDRKSISKSKNAKYSMIPASLV